MEETSLVLCRLHMAKSGVSSYGIREKWEEAVSTAHAEVQVFFTFSPSQSSPFVHLNVSTSLQPKPSFPPTSPKGTSTIIRASFTTTFLCVSQITSVLPPSLSLPTLSSLTPTPPSHPLCPPSLPPYTLPLHTLHTLTSSPPYPSPSTPSSSLFSYPPSNSSIVLK